MGATAHKINRGESMRDVVIIYGTKPSPERLERIKQICEEIEKEAEMADEEKPRAQGKKKPN